MPHRISVPVAALALAALAAGCAAPDDPVATAERRGPVEYRTGSNIPVREKAAPLTEEQRQRQVDELRRAQQNQSTATSGRPGS
jgi:hypothetical protein